MQKQETKTVRIENYQNKEADQFLESNLKEIPLKTYQQAKRDAENGLPKEQGDQGVAYYTPILNYVQQCIDKLRKLHQADEGVHLNLKKLEDERKVKVNQRDHLKKELEAAKKRKAQCTGAKQIVVALIVAFLVLTLSLGEGLLSQQAIQSLIGNYWIALYTSIVLGFGFALLAHHFLKLWMKPSQIKLLIRVGLVAFFTMVFAAIGILRSYSINNQNASIQEAGKGFMEYVEPQQVMIQMLLMWLVFLMSILLSKYLPSSQEVNQMIQSRKEQKSIRRVQKELLLKEQEIKDLDEQIIDIEQYHYSRKQAAQRDEKTLLNTIPSIPAHYASVNKKYRKGETIPDCFKNQDISYPFTTYFQKETETQEYKTEQKSVALFPKLILILFSFLALSSCRRTQPVPILDLVVFNDNTNKDNPALSYGDIRETLEIEKYYWYAYDIKNVELTELTHGLSSQTHLPRGDKDYQLLSQRKQLVRDFLLKTEQLFTPRYPQINDKSQSYLYQPIAAEINRLVNQSKATNKWMIINSDMLEHNPDLSFYDKETRALLYSNHKAIIDQFQKICPLAEDLTGITIFMVHHASPEDNELFSKVAQLYQFILTSRGAKCLISAGNVTPKIQQP